MNGTEFYTQLGTKTGKAREDAILKAAENYQAPGSLTFTKVTVELPLKGTLEIMAANDYFAIGTETDNFLMPCFPDTAEALADKLLCVLPTVEMVDALWRQSIIKQNPKFGIKDMCSNFGFYEHNLLVKSALKNLSKTTIFLKGRPKVIENFSEFLIAGHKKDLVQPRNRGKVAIYGWHDLQGKPIQGYNTTSHNDAYVDYSHGVRFISRSATLNGVEIDLKELSKWKKSPVS